MIENFGNIDVKVDDRVVVLRMRHVVDGHPGCWLTADEADTLATHLNQCAASIRKIAPKTKLKRRKLQEMDDIL